MVKLKCIVQFKRYHTETLVWSKIKVLVCPWNQSHKNLNSTLSTLPTTYLKSLVKIHPLVQKIVCQRVFIGWWHWNLGQGHQNLIISLLARIYCLVQEITYRNPILVEIWHFKVLVKQTESARNFLSPEDKDTVRLIIINMISIAL